MLHEAICDGRHVPDMLVPSSPRLCIRDETDVAVHLWMHSTAEARRVGRLVERAYGKITWIAMDGCLTILKPASGM